MRSFSSYSGGRKDIAPEASDYVDCRVLAANVSEQCTIPVGANYVTFAGNLDFFVKFQPTYSAISVPAADVSDGSAATLNPGARKIPAGTTSIAVIAAAATIVTLEYYS